MNRLIIILLIFNVYHINAQTPSLVAHKKILKLMGSRFELTAVAESDKSAWEAINKGIKEIQRIESLISSWSDYSQTSQINTMAGLKPVKVDRELFDLIYRCNKISSLTNGAFDISFASMDKIWEFNGSMSETPDSSTITLAASKINWRDIIMDSEASSVFLKNKGMKIGFGAIGKGYAANRAKAIMKDMEGIRGGLVNASGDLTAWGVQPNYENWKINITNPLDKSVALAWLNIANGAVVTSGDYEKFVILNGKRYAHIIDPRTGYPTTGIKSVTIVCPDAELADALATSVFVLGRDEGLKLIDTLDKVECLIVTDSDEIMSSKHLKINYFK